MHVSRLFFICVFSTFQVLADQAVWAVCGRAAAVIDMSTSKKQTIVVEVMPLVGGHLLLPKIRLSKYIPAEATASNTESIKPGTIKTCILYFLAVITVILKIENFLYILLFYTFYLD